MADREPLRIEFVVTLDDIVDRGCRFTGGEYDPHITFQPEGTEELRRWASRVEGYFRVTIEEVPENEPDSGGEAGG